MKNSRRKTSKTLLIILSIPLLAGLVLFFQLAKADFIATSSFAGKPQLAYPPPEDTPVDFNSPTITPFPTTTQTPTPIVLENGWYLYEDKEAGFSFSYPPEVYLSTSKEGFFDYKTVRIAFKPSGFGYQGMEINLFSNPDDLSLVDVAQKIYSYSGNIPSLSDLQDCLKPVTIGSVSAFKSTYQPALARIIVFVPMQDKVLYAMAVTKMGLTDFAPSSQEMFEKILATLTFKP